MRVICTIGPSCESVEILSELKRVGVDIFRINLSHAPLSDISRFSEIASKLDLRVGIDTEGAQIRTHIFASDSLFLATDDIHYFPIKSDCDKELSFTLTPQSVLSSLKSGDTFRVDFHGALVRIVDIFDDYISAVVLKEGSIGNNKGVDCLNRQISLEDFTAKDIEAINLCKKYNINDVFISFCKNPQAVEYVRSQLPNCFITSKIENRASIHSLTQICEASDAILIDRGDLSREISILDIPFAQRGIINNSSTTNTPCYVATNVLESLIDNDLPTRAELNDIVSTIEMGASGIVLAAETAIGKHPVLCAEIVRELSSKYSLFANSLLFADLDRNEITDAKMKLWLNRF